MAATISANSAGGGGLVSSGDASGVLALQTAGVTALSIDASQKVTFANSLTSPTLVTPVLGTPSSGVLSSCTGVNMCKAWVNFDGTLAIGTITPRASFNVTSVTKNAVGDFTINFTNAMADANYVISGACNQNIAGNRSSGWDIYNTGTTSLTTTSCRINTGSMSSGGAADTTINSFMIFGN